MNLVLWLVLTLLGNAELHVSPTTVTLQWDDNRPHHAADRLIAALGPPTKGACWMQCSWGDHLTLTVHKTRTVNYSTLELSRR